MAEDIRYADTLRGPLGESGTSSRSFREGLTDARRRRGIYMRAYRQARKQGDYMTALDVMSRAQQEGLRVTGPQSYESLRENVLRQQETRRQELPILERQQKMLEEGLAGDSPSPSPARTESGVPVLEAAGPPVPDTLDLPLDRAHRADIEQGFDGGSPMDEDMSTTDRLRRRRELFERMRRSAVSRGTVPTDALEEARSLGVSNAGFGNALSRLRMIGRQSLYRQMQEASSRGSLDDQNDPYTAFSQQAQGLGVSRNSFNNALSRIRRSSALR